MRDRSPEDRVRSVLLIAGWALVLAFSNRVLSAAENDAPRPNILIIFTDDQGYADLGCYGNTKNKTPRMDQLAKEGTRFTSFYAQTVCGPSRSALLTGRYPNRSGGWGMPADEITFAELIAQVGYQTACIGKWDVSSRKPIVDRMPLAQGFDYYFGTLGANDGGRVTFHENNEQTGSTRDMGSLLRLYTDKAIDYLKNRRDPDKPFVLYVAHTMMHTIIDASGRFKGKSSGGLYGDVVEEFDYETGRLLDTLDDLGLAGNTLVIYTSDNGPWNQPAYTSKKKGHPAGSIFWGEAGPLRNGKGSCYEAGYRVPCIVRWPGKVPAGRVSDAIFATIDFLPTFANLAGFEIPADRVMDGYDQTDLLFGNTERGRDTFLYRNNAIRLGKWKYLKAKHNVYRYAIDSEREEVEELYNLETDIGETTNLAGKHPEIVERLSNLLDGKTQSLLQNHNLQGWKVVNGGEWSVKNGVLTGRKAASISRHCLLVTEQSYRDFRVRLEYKAIEGDSGFYFRLKPAGNELGYEGYHAQIHSDGTHAGGLFDVAVDWLQKPDPELVKKAFKPGKWNTMTIEAVGPKITVDLNGHRMSAVTGERTFEGLFGIQLHADENTQVQFRNLELTELKD